MKLVSFLLLALLAAMHSSCASMNDEFSCSKSAFDHCLDIEDVDAMTEGKTVVKRTTVIRKQQWAAEENLDKETVASAQRPVWIAPYRDEKGQTHGSKLLYADKARQAKSLG